MEGKKRCLGELIQHLGKIWEERRATPWIIYPIPGKGGDKERGELC